MPVQRISEIIELLQAFALGEANMSKRRVRAAVALLDLAVPDARPPDDGDKVLRTVFGFPGKFVA